MVRARSLATAGRRTRSPGAKLGVLIASMLLAAGASAQSRNDRPLYKDPAAPVEQRVQDLLSRMTLEEKIAQITAVWTKKNELLDAKGNFVPNAAQRLYPAGIGHFTRPSDRQEAGSPLQTPFRNERETVELINAIQRHATRSTRLGIPVLFHEEGLHGHQALGATHFPQAIALASSWDPQLLERIFTVVAREIRARGAHLVLAPVVDVARDPRWGRFEETYGEDPFLVSTMGVAAVRGFQGTTLPLPKDRVFATLKHMTGHGQPESGTNVGPANISERILREVFFPPFQAAVAANAQAVMPSYNEIDGVPSHNNRWLLQDILRGEMGFKGAIVSDYFAIKELIDVHHLTTEPLDAAVYALKTGVSSDLPNGDSYALLPRALAAGRIQQADIDRAVGDMLRLKFLAGLFEQPYADAKYAEKITGNAEARALALEAARKSVVLLKNDGALPLRADGLKTLAVIGPNAARVELGGYSNVPKQVVTLLDGIKTKVGQRVNVVSAEGVRLTESGDWYTDEVVRPKREDNLERIKEAVSVAQSADAIVLAIGGSSALHREAWAKNHLGDSLTIGLTGEQNELAQAMFALGKPVVVVLLNGQPLSIPQVIEQANGVLEGWYPGQEGGTALADVLFGDANPGGKLPVTVARDIGQLPFFYNQKPSAHRGYHFDSKEPLFPFGFGLSYTKFELGEPKLSSARISANDNVKVSVDVRNVGSMQGDEVVQLYVRDVASSITRPVKELKAFRRVSLQPGASTTVEFTLAKEAFAFWNQEMKYMIEPGEFSIMTGPNSVDLKSATLTIGD
ncbi:glycoside hydrolase family 3 N-terminal domain-containing protein [Steroidobacter cummioxidans]|uniref:glycoside hydrolase family 3 N-terminal domain-containing protein n=1 Tax=Steroidobacter cummioxidans TaxID=1803913 RepID=UPI000E31E6AB|nr:glycoside hydrolase family 3 N-terminal domain-containing protein [Steroidobacter cummioxidans]